MYEIFFSNTTVYAPICYLRSEWADGTSSRSSAVIVGPNDVLTALHAVYSADQGGWARKVTVIPGADTLPVSKPLGEFTNVGTMVGRGPDWDIDGDGLLSPLESQADMALLGMTSRIGDLTGWLPAAKVPNDFFGVMAGYPARGTGLMAESVFADASGTNSIYNINSGLGAGASGGPLLYTSGSTTSVVGVLSSGNASNTVSTYAGLFSDVSWDWLQSAMSANDSLLGASLPNSVVTAAGTVFSGGSGADSFVGGNGWDSLRGNAGDDVLDGGVGVDTAIYSGVRVTYTVAASAGRVTVSDTVASRDGADTLLNVERVKFSDVSLAFDVNGSGGQAYRLYQAAFNRGPDTAGLGYQMKALDDGLTLAQVANNFINSPEFQRTYGNPDTAQFVNLLYANVLHRGADAAGFAFHTGNLASGANSRADVLVGFSESPENQAALIGTIQNGMVYTV